MNVLLLSVPESESKTFPVLELTPSALHEAKKAITDARDRAERGCHGLRGNLKAEVDARFVLKLWNDLLRTGRIDPAVAGFNSTLLLSRERREALALSVIEHAIKIMDDLIG